MAGFFDLLRCILCGEEEDPRPYCHDAIAFIRDRFHEYTGFIRDRFQNPSTTHYTRVPDYDPPTPISPNNYAYFYNQPHEQKITRTQSLISTQIPTRSAQVSDTKPSLSYSTTTSSVRALAQPVAETPKRNAQVSDTKPSLSSSTTASSVRAFVQPVAETPTRSAHVSDTKLSLSSSTTASSVRAFAQLVAEAPTRSAQASDVKSFLSSSTTVLSVRAFAQPVAETPKRSAHVSDTKPSLSSSTTASSVRTFAQLVAEAPTRSAQASDVKSSLSSSTTVSSIRAFAQPVAETPKRSAQVSDTKPSLSSSTTASYIRTFAQLVAEAPTRSAQASDVKLSLSSLTTASSVRAFVAETPKRSAQVSDTKPSLSSSTMASSVRAFAQPVAETPKRSAQVSDTKPSLSSLTKASSFAQLVAKAPQRSAQVSNAKPSLSSTKPASMLSGPDLSSTSSSSGISQISVKPILSRAPLNRNVSNTKANYLWVEKGGTSLYMIPEDIKGLIEKDIVPGVLKKPLSSLIYTDYFAALLYAEDYYLEKWDGFEMEDVSLELEEAEIHGWKSKNRDLNRSNKAEIDKIFVVFKIDSVAVRPPFLLSRDFASVRPSGKKVEPFQGVIYRVVNSNFVLIEFGEDFLSQHHSSCKYDVKFSFNRVCLKRAHQAIAAVASSNIILKNFVFPVHKPIFDKNSSQTYFHHKLDLNQLSAVRQILCLLDPPPYLIEGPLSVSRESKQLSRTGVVVKEAVLQVYQTSPSLRILICTPVNSTCDVLMRSLQMEIPESHMFRANAAFREVDKVPDDIIPSCLYEGECFTCPPLKELKKYKVIFSTYMSSFKLRSEGIVAGHFSHIFLVDASWVTEPETMVPLVNLADENTVVVVTGDPSAHSGWIRSHIARGNGLKTSYFERLWRSEAYN